MTVPVQARHVVVDGSNIATEGRSMPSLAQLDEAVREYRREFPDDIVVVVVDATFGHRIDESERALFDEAVAHNEIVSPPAGAIGRGDAFLLRVAEKVGATVLSNDSFQEFHGEYDWLFTNGRLIGGKPVPGVGWIFTPRTPVRGPRSRDSIRTAKRVARRTRPEEQQQKVQKAIAVATEEAVQPDSPSVKRRRRRRGSSPPAEPVNEPLVFIELVANHPLGSAIEGEVESFSSHGAFIEAAGARCYIPLTGLGEPPPRAAKDVLRKGERRTFVIQALDPPRRGVELALPEFARISGAPSPETVEEEIRKGAAAAARGTRRRAGRRAPEPAEEPVPEAEVPAPAAEAAKRPARRGRTRKAAAVPAADGPAAEPPEPPPPTPSGRKAPAPRKAAAEKTTAEKAPAGEKAPARKSEATKAEATKAEATKAEATKSAPTKAEATKAEASKAAASKAAATEAVPESARPVTPAEKPAARKAASRKTTAKVAAATKKAAAKRTPTLEASPEEPAAAPATAKRVRARKPTTDEAPAKAAARKAPARKVSAR